MEKRNKMETNSTTSSVKHFTPPYSVTSRIQITNKSVELRLLAGIMEKLRYKMAVKKSIMKEKNPYRILSDEPYKTEPVNCYSFYTGAKYTGPFGTLGIDGYGEFQFPSGIVYHGNIFNNMFAGEGLLLFPSGGVLKAFWIQGVAFNPRYTFPDGLHYEHSNWNYCRMPDRRFFSEYDTGLKPSGNIQLANNHPARGIPTGHFDCGEGFYEPFSRELIHPLTGKFLRIPSEWERQWILKYCRREWVTPIPFDPDLYENWFPQYNKEKGKLIYGSLWKGLLNALGERTGMEKKIKHMFCRNPKILDTDTRELFYLNNLLNTRYKKKI